MIEAPYSRLDLLKQIPGPSKKEVPKGQIANQLRFLREMHRKYGPIFRLWVYSEDVIMMLGEDSNRYVLFDKESNFAGGRGWEKTVGRFFKGSLLVRDFEEHVWIRRIIAKVLLDEVFLRAYVDTISAVVQREIKDWSSIQNFLFHPHIKQLSLDLIIATFLGIQDKNEAMQITHALNNATVACHAWLRYPIPGSTYWKGIKGREFLVNFLCKRIQQNRQATGEPWLLNQLCVLKDHDGRSMTDDEIINQLVFVLFAGHYTTALALDGAAFLLAKHPEWQDRLREESKSLGDQFTYDDLDKLKSYEMLLNEAIRMYPPARGLRRYALRDFNFKDYHIPGKTIVTVSIYYTHFSPEYWTNPDEFDPERFSDERAEHKKSMGRFIPFGEGPHKCLGTKFFMMDGKIILHHLLQKYRLKIPADYALNCDKLVLHLIPSDGFPLTLEPL